MTRKVITTEQAPAAIGPYAQGIVTESLLFISGQLPLNPLTGKMVEGDIGNKTRQIMKNAAAIAEKAGTGLDRAVKTTIFLTDLNDFQEVNRAYGETFTQEPPARSTIQVAALPLGSPIEIEFVVTL